MPDLTAKSRQCAYTNRQQELQMELNLEWELNSKIQLPLAIDLSYLLQENLCVFCFEHFT